MSAGHTPGVWRATGRTGPVMLGYSQPYGVAGTGDQIAHLICGCFGDTPGGEDAAEANARLIAASPELLAACAALLRYDGMVDSDGMAFMKAYADAVRLAKTAVIKATGAAK